MRTNTFQPWLGVSALTPIINTRSADSDVEALEEALLVILVATCLTATTVVTLRPSKECTYEPERAVVYSHILWYFVDNTAQSIRDCLSISRLWLPVSHLVCLVRNLRLSYRVSIVSRLE